jgi:hypothetical protein
MSTGGLGGVDEVDRNLLALLLHGLTDQVIGGQLPQASGVPARRH